MNPHAYLLAVLVALAVHPALHAAQPQPSLISQKASRSLLLDIAHAGKRLVAVGERGHVVVSDDDGVSWRQVPVPTRAMLTAVHFPTADVGFAVGHDSTIIATTDGGRTWAIQYFREHVPASEAVADDAASLATEEYSDEEYADDEAAGGREEASREGVPLLDVWFADARSGIAVGAYGLLLRTVDGGKTWEDGSAGLGNRDGWHLNAIVGLPGSNAVVFIAGEKGTLYRSDDLGATFRSLPSPGEGSFFGLLGAPDGMLFAFGLQGKFFGSRDQGLSWWEIGSGVTSGLNDGCVAGDGTVIVAGNAGVVLGVGKSDAVARHVRSDRLAVLSCVASRDGLVLVGEGGAKRATITGATR